MKIAAWGGVVGDCCQSAQACQQLLIAAWQAGEAVWGGQGWCVKPPTMKNINF